VRWSEEDEQTRDHGSILGRSTTFSLVPPVSTPALRRTHPRIQCWGRFLKPPSLDLTTHLQLQPSLRMSGAIPLLPPTSLHGVFTNSITLLYYRLPQRCCWGFESSGMWRRVTGWAVPNVSTDRSAFILGSISPVYSAWADSQYTKFF